MAVIEHVSAIQGCPLRGVPLYTVQPEIFADKFGDLPFLRLANFAKRGCGRVTMASTVLLRST